MTTFDRLKIVFPAEHFEVTKGFRQHSEEGVVIGESFIQKQPCYIAMSVNYQTNQARIEFTGKVLKARYDELINLHNIHYCLDAINNLGVCKLDVDSILDSAEVEKCDVTKDVEGIDLCAVKNYIVNHIDNYNKWATDTYQQNNNISISNKVQKKDQKKFLQIYDKGKELTLSKNKFFRQWAGEDVVQRMRQCVRFEVKINHYKLVQTMLHIDNRKLMIVLNADSNPITDFFRKSLRKDSGGFVAKKWTIYKNTCILQCNNWDLSLLESNMRFLCGKNYNTNLMEPFRQIVDERNRTQTSTPIFDYQTICTFDNKTYSNSTATATSIGSLSSEYWNLNTENTDSNVARNIIKGNEI